MVPRRLHWILLVAGGGLTLLAGGIVIYATHIRASANALITSARKIHSTADATREIALWRNRSGPQFWEESDHLGGDHNYDGQIDNLSLARFGVLEPAGITLSVTMHGGELRSIALMMTAGKRPNTTASVWVQEWFDSNKTTSFLVRQKDKPRAAIVEFSASIPEAQRDRALTLNSKCLAQFDACNSAADILPGVWEMENLPLAYRYSGISDAMRPDSLGLHAQ